jgi:hypothetical protein
MKPAGSAKSTLTSHGRAHMRAPAAEPMHVPSLQRRHRRRAAAPADRVQARWRVRAAGRAGSMIRYRCRAGESSSRCGMPPTTSPACRRKSPICRNGRRQSRSCCWSRAMGRDDGADWRHEGAEPSRRAGVQSRPQGYPLGETEAQEGPVTIISWILDARSDSVQRSGDFRASYDL